MWTDGLTDRWTEEENIVLKEMRERVCSGFFVKARRSTLASLNDGIVYKCRFILATNWQYYLVLTLTLA